jgi:cation:H+ antiporter
LVAARRGQDDIAVGNVIGSCIFNVLGIAGITALVHPLPVPAEIVDRDAWWMLGFAVILFPLMVTRWRIVRAEGALLFAGFLAYMGLLIWDATR